MSKLRRNVENKPPVKCILFFMKNNYSILKTFDKQ